MGARAVRDPAPAGVHHLPPGEPPGQPAQQHHGQEVRGAGEGGWAPIQPTNPNCPHNCWCCSHGQDMGGKHWELGSGFRLLPDAVKKVFLEEADAIISCFTSGHE